MNIVVDDLRHPAVQALIREHLQSMYAQSPPESVHALDLERLRGADVTFWTAWDGDVLLGCGALQELDARHGEIKSMRTPETLRRRGAGKALLAHIIGVARQRGYERLSLETGSFAAFAPARRLYASFGFTHCGPFAKYAEDPLSSFMTLDLGQAPGKEQSMFAQTPEPPYYAVIFSSSRTSGDDGYDSMAATMVALAQQQPGFLGIETTRGADGFGITVSYWESEAAIAQWKAVSAHRAAQQRGINDWYAHYELRVAKVERAYGKAPPDKRSKRK